MQFRRVGAFVAAVLLASGCSEPQDTSGGTSGTSVSDDVSTSAVPPPDSEQETVTQPPPEPVDLADHLTDEELLEQTRWALDLVAPGATVISDEDYAERFAPVFQEAVSAFELSLATAGLRTAGPYTVTAAAQDGRTRAATVQLHSPDRPLIMSISLDGEGRIDGLFYQEDTSGEPPEISGWADLDAALAELGGETQVVVGEIRGDACTVVHTTEGSPEGGAPFPVASTVKLLVLSALVDAVEAGDLSWDQELEVTDDVRSLPSGTLQDSDPGTTVTVREAASLMISISDNTATDLLIGALGQGRIARAAQAADVDTDRVTPLLTTKELFVLGWGVPQETRDDWSAAGTPEAREKLRSALPQDLSAVDVASVTSPVWQDGVDWFLTGQEVCSVLARLHVQGGTDAGGPVREILSANPGGTPTVGVTYQGFKGGSAPGVLSLAFYLETADAGPDAPDGHVLVTQTRSDGQVDQLRAATVVQAGLAHLAGADR